MFDNLDRMKQGDLGEAKAIYELVRLGYWLSKPLHVHLPYDLIAEKDNKLYKVQVKTSSYVIRESTQAYQVNLATTGGNRVVNTRKLFDPSSVDLVFVMTSDDRCWLIPSSEINATGSMTVGTNLYERFQVSGPVVQRPMKQEVKERVDGRVKTPPFSKQQLQELLNKHPTTDVAAMFNMSDNGIARWAKKWNLSKPPRGYWQKLQSAKK